MPVNVDAILDGLNDKQKEAVTITDGPALVISGPGSGKTRALTHRIAYLIATGVRPSDILAVTFTNKAAGEIKERVKQLLHGAGLSVKGLPSMGTFHSIGLRILRVHAEKVGLGTDFSILDSADQKTLIKRVVSENGLDDTRYKPGPTLGKISKLKTELSFWDRFTPKTGTERTLAQIYTDYQKRLLAMNAVDFGDLIALPVRIFKEHKEVLGSYQHQWRYILVDEYQDTSHDQYTFVNLLAKGHKNLFCIGDDAQSIYLFRQADIRNILNFQRDWPNARIILLEQNYRSTKNILAAAQSVIANNTSQFPKQLWTDNTEGELITVTESFNERTEARGVVQKLMELKKQRYVLSDCAILYRTHAQSRAMEEALVGAGVPYRIVGGLRFYERREIKDILAYLRLVHNPVDVVSFERVANVPKRGIGPATVDQVVAVGGNLVTATRTAAEAGGPRSKGKLTILAGLLENFRGIRTEKTVRGLIAHIVARTGYKEYLKTTKDLLESADERLENVRELLTVARKYDSEKEDGLAKFLEEVALVQDADTLEGSEKAVTLMTMHAAKGLEYPVVFVIGMEEGLFPHSRTQYNPEELEEERRLCYVAVTRAKERLHVSHAKWRNIYGSRNAGLPSRFLDEMPENLLYRESAVDDWTRYDTSDDETISYE